MVRWILLAIFMVRSALQQLLEVLGYDLQGRHSEQRKLIFVGDLCDRGPDSIAVIRQVKTLIENGNAQCILVIMKSTC